MYKIFITIIYIFSSCFLLNAQQSKKAKTTKATMQVKGTCNMCKERIEGAVNELKGIKKVSWDKQTENLVVVFNNKKTNIEAIQQAILAKGHDVNNLKASDEVYKKLPSCCAYRDGATCNH